MEQPLIIFDHVNRKVIKVGAAEREASREVREALELPAGVVVGAGVPGN